MVESKIKNLLSYKVYIAHEKKDWVIFLHGIGGDSRTFSLQLKEFNPHFNLLFPDLRGHGASRNMSQPPEGKYSLQLIASDVFRLMKFLGIERAHFVGVSFGVVLIREMQEIHPERFISVVASGSVLRLNTAIYSVFRIGKFLAPYISNYLLYKIVAYIIMPRKNHARSRQMFLKAARKIDPKEYISWLVLLSETKIRLDTLFSKGFQTPVLLITGRQDHAFLKDDIRFCLLNPETQLQIIPNCGHLSNIDHFSVFNRLALNFLNKYNHFVKPIPDLMLQPNFEARQLEYSMEI